MRKTMAVLAAVAAMLLTVAAIALADGGTHVKGNAQWFNGVDNVHAKFNGKIHDNDGSVKGHVSVAARDPDGNDLFVRYQGDITCIDVVGNTVWVSGPIDKSKGSSASDADNYFLWAMQDNSKGPKGTPRDMGHTHRGANPTDCTNHTVVPDQEVTKGDISIDTDTP
jgi:hypothetical protein